MIKEKSIKNLQALEEKIKKTENELKALKDKRDNQILNELQLILKRENMTMEQLFEMLKSNGTAETEEVDEEKEEIQTTETDSKFDRR